MHQQHPGLYFAPSDKHRLGIFCTEDIMADSVVEICPVLILEVAYAEKIVEGHPLYGYYFEWAESDKALALGYGSLYNHGPEPNASFETDYAHEHIIFRSVRDIPAGEEILVDYHEGIPGKPLWFEVQ